MEKDWQMAPPDVHQRYALASLVRLEPDGRYSVIFGYVMQSTIEPYWSSISEGDHPIVCLGEWSRDGNRFELRARSCDAGEGNVPADLDWPPLPGRQTSGIAEGSTLQIENRRFVATDGAWDVRYEAICRHMGCGRTP
jgi:hypothetical protein